ncbi:MAG: tetratricopeptide repeat protein [Bdellovibrio sp.]|nr:tetratricopeptide repeat protein [Bdellovibrio sp.]
MKFAVVLILSALFLSGCLKTRNEVRDNEQRQVQQQQTVSMQKAEASSRVTDLEEQIRELTGRVDVVENRQGQSNSGVENALKTSSEQNRDLNQKVAILQEALIKMEKDVYALNAEIGALKAQKAAAQAEAVAAKNTKKDHFEAAQKSFDSKEWKQAILSYQKYRDEYPKGQKFADATYKIGVSFQELGMKDEAKTFYDEVIGKFPKSEEARRAKIRLKGLKK